MGRINVIVTSKQGGPVSAESIRADLQNVGFAVASDMSQMGVLTGSISEDKLADLKRVRGVTSVETDRTISVPPIDSEEPA